MAEKTRFPPTELLTEKEQSDSSPLDGDGCVLWVANGNHRDAGQRLSITACPLVVGTDPGCDLALTDPKVSRQHVELSAVPEGVLVRDLESTNGTLYLGNRIGQAVLQPGARLLLGKTEVLLLPRPGDSAQLLSNREAYGPLLGSSLPMRQLFAQLERLEGVDVPVVILGETGTGKELIARALHEHSGRSRGPLVVVDCGALSPNLVESALFGHRRGAFTNAIDDRVGAFAQADHGTLFLDEIGELPLDIQSRLLRVLENRQIKRVGDDRYQPVDVRVIAATNRDLTEMVAAGQFREDLYYRQAVVSLNLPPLRERREDISLLADLFARGFCEQMDRPLIPLPPEMMRLMVGHDWPGNVRELRNAVQRVLALGQLEVEPTDPEATTAAVDASMPYKSAREAVLSRFEAAYLQDLLQRHEGNITHAARSAGIARHYLRSLLRKHGLYAERSDDAAEE